MYYLIVLFKKLAQKTNFSPLNNMNGFLTNYMQIASECKKVHLAEDRACVMLFLTKKYIYIFLVIEAGSSCALILSL